MRISVRYSLVLFIGLFLVQSISAQSFSVNTTGAPADPSVPFWMYQVLAKVYWFLE
jgi:hypothetical protein